MKPDPKPAKEGNPPVQLSFDRLFPPIVDLARPRAYRAEVLGEFVTPTDPENGDRVDFDRAEYLRHFGQAVEDAVRADALMKARTRGHLAGERAARRVDARRPGWFDAAIVAVRRYALTHRTFLAEEVRESFTLPAGADGRAWGAVMREAVRLGVIEARGTSSARSSNGSPKILWASLVLESEGGAP